MKPFLWGMLTAANVTAAIFFLRYWKTSRDRLFIFFSLAFMAMAINWMGLAMIDPRLEKEHYVFMTRLLAFGLIIVGVIDKNRRSDPRP